jgi:RNA polymerase sigma factor (TIGR02999 family)
VTTSSPKDVTEFLLDWSRGDPEAPDKLMPLVYDELRRIASQYLRRERRDHTLQPTALVHEAYLKLVDQQRVNWQNRAHFFAIAAQAMRRILVSYARKHLASKRGGQRHRLTLDEAMGAAQQREVDLIALDEALTSLEAIDPQQSRIIELRFFGGLSLEETAQVIGVSPATVKREWTMARAWLHRQMSNVSETSDE